MDDMFCNIHTCDKQNTFSEKLVGTQESSVGPPSHCKKVQGNSRFENVPALGYYCATSAVLREIAKHARNC